MKVLVITTSRADWNGLALVGEELTARGHDVAYWDAWGETVRSIFAGKPLAGRAGEPWDVALLAGDRRETLATAALCSTEGVPIAHLAGGDVTLGSADDRFRDAITALASLHFATNIAALGRLERLREDAPHRVIHTGAPAVDRAMRFRETAQAYDSNLPAYRADIYPNILIGEKNLVVAVHPNTDGAHAPRYEAQAVSRAVQRIVDSGWTVNILASNADPGHEDVTFEMKDLRDNINLKRRGKHIAKFHKNLQPDEYFALLMLSDLMVGNSSAAYYEAPVFGLQCIDVGDRQKGRTRPSNVHEVPVDDEVIEGMIRVCCGMPMIKFPDRKPVSNPYGDGTATKRIADALEQHYGKPS